MTRQVRHAWGGLALVAAFLGSCGNLPPPGYDFVTHSISLDSPATREIEGELTITRDLRSDAWCLVLDDGSSRAIPLAWPDNYALVVEAEGEAEVHGDGVVLREGQRVRLGLRRVN
jgi:hypothetical protein